MMLDQLNSLYFIGGPEKDRFGFSSALQKSVQMKLVLSTRKLWVPLLFSVLDVVEDITRPAKSKITINILLHNKFFSKITCLSRGPLCICKRTKKPKTSNVSGNILEEDVRLDMVMITLP